MMQVNTFNSSHILPLAKRYSEIEFPAFNLNNKPVHLYPTEEVKQVLTEADQRHLNADQKKTYIIDNFNAKKLQISKDTTIYYPESTIQKLVTVITETNFIREGVPLQDNHYIYIIDLKDRFVVDTKRITDEGRVQHTSLSGGADVKTAGVFQIFTNTLTGLRTLAFENYSGHFEPPTEDMDQMIKLFATTKFKLISDTNKTESWGILRQITLAEQRA